MKNIKALSNEALLQNTKTLVVEERRLTAQVLWHLHEIQKRRLFAEQGYGSLFEYTVKELHYSEPAAGRRIAAMRLLVEIPEVEPALEKGDVSLSTLCTLQNFFKRKETPTSREEKVELVFALQGKSRRECEKRLSALAPEAVIPPERERAVSPSQTEIRFVADDALMEKLQKIRELDAHVSKDTSYLELFHRLADIALKKLDPLASKRAEHKPSEGSRSDISTPPAERKALTAPKTAPTATHRRYVPAAMKRVVWTRDQGSCTYESPDGKRCLSKFALEIDHIHPLALGGKTELPNLRLLCRAHNRQQALSKLGARTMRPYLRA